jgi:NAD+ kinase
MTKTRKPRKTIPHIFGFVIKHHQPEAASLAVELAHTILNYSLETSVIIADESEKVAKRLVASVPKFKKRVRVLPKAKLVEACDVILVLGGDGTFLSIARLMKNHSTPLMGINMGQLGFLTEIKKTEAVESIQELMMGMPPIINERSLLEVTLRRKNRVIFQGPVVNDVVVSKGAIARIIGLQIAVNGRWVHNVRADGIIVSTPTGSTAYSLAAGGPIIEPSLGALILTAICPHSLTQRPLVISDDSEISIRLDHRPGHVLLTLDGQDAVSMNEGDIVTVRCFKKHALKLISSPSRDYFSLLREKLKFGMRD